MTRRIDAIEEGRPDAADARWHRHFERVVAVARRRLNGDSHRAVEDAQDVASSAIHSLCAGAARGRFESLGDPTLRQVALWRMDGLSNAEIAEKLGCVLRTVERKIERIRLIWEEIGAAPDDGIPREGNDDR